MIKKEQSPKQQIAELIKQGNKFLVITHSNPDGDAISSVLSLKLVLEKMGKKADVVVPDKFSDEYSFLPSVKSILTDLKINQDLVVNIKSKENAPFKISYDKKENGSVDLVITPSGGAVNKEDVALFFGKFDYDALFILDTGNLDKASSFYEKNKDIFGKIPIVNIDHHSTNTGFGAINLVDQNATSTSEVLVSLIESMDKTLINEDVATLLLAGIISDTDRFQNYNTTPKSLTVAAQLIAGGARRSEIVKNVFKTHSIPTLKLWGKILSNIKEDKDSKIVWSAISQHEIEETGASEADTEGVMNELVSTAPNAMLTLLLIEEKPGTVRVSMRTGSDKVELDKIALLFGGGGHSKAAGFKIEGMNLANAEKDTLEKLKNYFGGYAPKQDLEFKQEKAEIKESESVVISNPQKERVVIESNEEDLYSPSLSDIELDKPKIIDEPGSSILQKVIENKRKREEEKMDFAKMEQELKRQNGTSGNSATVEIDDLDEDYE